MANQGISLHFGLNALDPAHYGGWPGTLNACEADANDMFDLAKRAGFSATKLLTKKCTRAALKAAFKAAAGKLKSGDTFFLTYSGHGGQLPDKNNDEPDGEDETWCLYDGEVVDDEMSGLYATFAAGVRIIVLSDSCHSGSVTKLRAFGLDNESNSNGGEKFRFMPPAVSLRTYRNNRAFYDPILKKAVASTPKATVLLISGCQDNQLSSDGTFNGLFTGTLLKVWKDGLFSGNYKELHKRIGKQMPPDQTPALFVYGAANAAFLAQKPFTI